MATTKFSPLGQFDLAGFASERRLAHIASYATMQLLMARACENRADVLDGARKKLRRGERLFARGFTDGGDAAPV
eukprot:2642928-Alexandrium_andersonii.AAC.1